MAFLLLLLLICGWDTWFRLAFVSCFVSPDTGIHYSRIKADDVVRCNERRMIFESGVTCCSWLFCWSRLVNPGRFCGGRFFLVPFCSGKILSKTSCWLKQNWFMVYQKAEKAWRSCWNEGCLKDDKLLEGQAVWMTWMASCLKDKLLKDYYSCLKVKLFEWKAAWRAAWIARCLTEKLFKSVILNKSTWLGMGFLQLGNLRLGRQTHHWRVTSHVIFAHYVNRVDQLNVNGWIFFSSKTKINLWCPHNYTGSLN